MYQENGTPLESNGKWNKWSGKFFVSYEGFRADSLVGFTLGWENDYLLGSSDEVLLKYIRMAS